MKKILMLLAVVGLTFTSCYQDEYEAPTGGETVKKAYFTEEEVSVPSTASYDMVVDFTEAFANDVLLSYTLDGTPMQIAITAGSTNAVLASVDVSVQGVSHTIELVAIASNGDAVAIDMDRKTMTVIYPFPPNYGDVNFALDWPGTVDIDAFIETEANRTGTTIDYSYYDHPEIVNLPATAADGTYYFYIDEWAFTADLDVTITVTEPDGTVSVFDTTITQDQDAMTFTKTTDATTGAVSYEYTVL